MYILLTAYRPCDPRLEFKCHDQRCIQKEAWCDNHYDCDDHSDEPPNCDSTNKPDSKCPSNLFDCKDGNCIRQGWLCDGDKDCSSGDDEVGCAGRFKLKCALSSS